MNSYKSRGIEMRIEGLKRIRAYAFDMSLAMEQSFKEYPLLEQICTEIVQDKEASWDLSSWRENSFNHTPEGLISIGTYLVEIGVLLEKVCCDREQIEVYMRNIDNSAMYVEDIGFYLVEIGVSLQGLGSLWRVIDPDMEYDVFE